MKYTERVTIRLTQAQLKILKHRANGKTMTIVLREYIAIMLNQDQDQDQDQDDEL